MMEVMPDWLDLKKGSVSGKVWLDDNYDGIMDSNELGMVWTESYYQTFLS